MEERGKGFRRFGQSYRFNQVVRWNTISRDSATRGVRTSAVAKAVQGLNMAENK